MAPKTISPWAHTLLHHRERFKGAKCWQLEALIGVEFGWGVGFSTFYLRWMLSATINIVFSVTYN